MKILFGVAEKGARGGINACEPPFIAAVRGLGTEACEEVYLFDNSESTSLSKRVANVRGAARRIGRRVAEGTFDVVHLNTSFELRSLFRDAYTLRSLSGSKVFLKFHGSDIGLFTSSNPMVRWLAFHVIGRADAVGVLSEEERAAFIAAGVPAEKVFALKNAVQRFGADIFPHVEKRQPLPFRLLFVSRLVPTKGLEDTIRALKILLGAGSDATLDVLGDGESKATAARLAEDLGIAKRVRFHGHVAEAEVRRFYTESDALVFPTFHDEGFPMVVFNALQFGLPIVTTRIRAAADFLAEGVNAVFCLPRNPADVAEKVERLIRDEALRNSMREANRKLSQEFLPETVAQEYLDVYRSLN